MAHWFNKAKKKRRWGRYLWMLGIKEVMRLNLANKTILRYLWMLGMKEVMRLNLANKTTSNC